LQPVGRADTLDEGISRALAQNANARRAQGSERRVGDRALDGVDRSRAGRRTRRQGEMGGSLGGAAQAQAQARTPSRAPSAAK
jgi:hypothetical protein